MFDDAGAERATIVAVDERAVASPDGLDVTLVYDGPLQTSAPALSVDGFAAERRQAPQRAACAWHVVLDARIAEPERFREARQLALYFATDFAPQDVVDVDVIRASGALRSGWFGVGETAKLRAPIDATVDPASAGADRVGEAPDPDAGAPPIATARPVTVRVSAGVEGTRVVTSSAGLSEAETIPLGQARTRGPRLLAHLRQRAARTQVASWRLPCVAPRGAQHQALFDGAPAAIVLTYDRAAWPLAVQSVYVEEGRVVAEGSFCWGEDAHRATATFGPGGQKVRASFASKARVSFPLPDEAFSSVTFADDELGRSASRALQGGPRSWRWAWAAALGAAVLFVAALLARRARR